MNSSTRSIKILGVGSVGKNILQRLGERHLPGVQLALVHTEPLPGAEFFPLDTAQLRALNLADAAACEAVVGEQRAALTAWCAGAELVFVVAGLGGKTGSGVSAVAARAAKAAGAMVLGFASMPFECEGNRRAQQAQAALEQLRAAGDGVVCLPNEKIMKLVGEEVGLRAVFTISDGLLADGVSGVARLLSCPSLIEINADDLRDLLRANRMESFFAAAEASGENRARDTVEQLLKNPLLDDGEALASAGSVLVSIVGGPGLTMAEIKRVMEQINRHCDGAQVVMGAGEDAALGDRLCVTVIATRRERITVAASASLGVMLPTTETEEEAAPAARFLPTPSLLAPTKLEMSGGKRPSLRGRKGGSKMKQEQLSLEMNAKGCFDKSEPTIRNGEDLDEPTYLRRGLVLN